MQHIQKRKKKNAIVMLHAAHAQKKCGHDNIYIVVRKQPKREAAHAAHAQKTNAIVFIRCVHNKSVLLSRHEKNKGFVCKEEVWGYCALTNEINADGSLYLSWYSKGNLGPVCLVDD